MAIEYQCPSCPNTEFKIQKKIGTVHINTGLYRCECTVCGHIETIQSKTPFNNGIDNDQLSTKKTKDEIKKENDFKQYE